MKGNAPVPLQTCVCLSQQCVLSGPLAGKNPNRSALNSSAGYNGGAELQSTNLHGEELMLSQ